MVLLEIELGIFKVVFLCIDELGIRRLRRFDMWSDDIEDHNAEHHDDKHRRNGDKRLFALLFRRLGSGIPCLGNGLGEGRILRLRRHLHLLRLLGLPLGLGLPLRLPLGLLLRWHLRLLPLGLLLALPRLLRLRWHPLRFSPLLRLPRLLRLLLRLLSLRLIACATDRIMVVVGRCAAVLRSFFHMFLRQYRYYSHITRDITNSCLNMLPIVVTLSWRTRVNEPYIIQLVNGFVPDNKAGALPMRQGAPQRLSTKDYRPNCMR